MACFITMQQLHLINLNLNGFSSVTNTNTVVVEKKNGNRDSDTFYDSVVFEAEIKCAPS